MAALTLLHVFSTFAVGGPQRRFAQLANRLGPDYAHRVIALDGRTEAITLIDQTVDVKLLDSPVPRQAGPGRYVTLRHFLSRTKPDLLCSYNWGAIDWAAANRLLPIAPHIHFEDGFGPEEAGGRQLPRRVWFRRLMLTGNSVVVVPSRTLYRIATETWRLSPKRLRYIVNGVDLDRFTALDPAKPPLVQRPETSVLIVSLGALRPEKAFDRLIAAVATLPPQVHLAIGGEGALRPNLEAAIAASGQADRLHLLGHVERPETLLAEADIFAMSSITEQMPIGLVEAMAAGLPVAATDVGDIMEMVAAPNRRFVVADGDSTAYGAALQRLVADAGLRHALGRANRQTALDRFAESTMVNAYDTLFRHTANRDL